MRKTYLKFFSMIELSLAIAVLTIASVALITLFFLGLKENKNSIGDNYCSISAEDIFTYISRISKTDWTTLLNEIPSTKPTSELTNTTGWINTGVENVYYLPSSSNGVFGIKKATENNVEDFNAEVLIWKQPVSDWALPSDFETGYDISGTIKCNPSANPSTNQTLIYGTTLSPSDFNLKDKSNSFTYNGVATMIKTRSQGSPTDKRVNLDNVENPAEAELNISGERYSFISGDMNINIVKSNPSQAEITFDARNVNIEPDPGITIQQDPPTSTAIVFEISWPVNIPYNSRNKRTFYFEVFDEENV